MLKRSACGLAERGGADSEPLFVSNRGDRLSRDAVERIVRKHVERGCQDLPDPQGQARNTSRAAPQRRDAATPERRGPHRDRALARAMSQSKARRCTSTPISRLKEKAMAKTQPVAVSPGRYRPNDELLAFLEGL